MVFNKKHENWNKAKKLKTRATKKLAGVKLRHAKDKVRQSGIRTKKHQRKVLQKQRFVQAGQLLLEAAKPEPEVTMTDIVVAPTKTRKPKARKVVAMKE